MNILVTGGTGFIGQPLCRELVRRGHSLTVLSRQGERALRVLPSGTRVLADLQEIDADHEIDAVINLAGEGIADRRWSDKRKQQLIDSRVGVTRALGELFNRLKKRPAVLINGSAVGFYGNAGAAELDESSPAARRDFSYLLCDAWEQEARRIAGQETRLCILRTGVVLARGGGMMARLLPVYRLGLGARLGDGSQWLSWVHLDDMLAMILLCLESPAAKGVFNAVAPQPVTHARFHEMLAAHCRRPGFLRVPAWPLRVALGEMSVLLLGGQRVMPRRLLEQGFRFRFASLDDAFSEILAGRGGAQLNG